MSYLITFYRLMAVALAAVLCLPAAYSQTIKVGAARIERYAPLLAGKRVALLSNHTGMVDGRHTLDVMLDHGINVTTIFSPEHGFRGNADAGEKVKGSVDAATGIPIASLYDGKKGMPSAATMGEFDVIVTDLQDVGVRYYTYYITMIDGPVLDMKYKSGVGALPIPVVHGMTLGELALMIDGEGWLDGGKRLGSRLAVIPCEGYTHSSRYDLPVAPSPNLKSMLAVYLYPSTCYFEGTVMSLGRGTGHPFEIYGHPAMKGCTYTFTPQSMDGAKNPPLKGKLCHGRDLTGLDPEAVIAAGVDLGYVIDAYRRMGIGDKFFTSFFELLVGDGQVRRMIEEGKSAAEIKATWRADVEAFKVRRRPYLLYKE